MKESIMNVLLQLMGLSYHLYYRAHAFHWNVMGSNFQQYHDFFGEVYEGVFGSIDDIAENARKLGAFPTPNFPTLLQYVQVDDTDASDATEQLANLKELNTTMIAQLRKAITVADEGDEPAISNFLQERLSYHQKLDWKLTALLAYTV